MSRRASYSRALLLVVSLLGLMLIPMTSSAGLVNRQFEFSSTQGPLIFGPTLGYFQYDDSIAPLGGGHVSMTNLFTDLGVSFGGFSFDETTANSGWIDFDASGQLLEAHFGNNCQTGGCVIFIGDPQWWIRVGEPFASVNDFAYSGFAGPNNDFYQTLENRLIPVPAAPSYLLLSVAIFMMRLCQLRKKTSSR